MTLLDPLTVVVMGTLMAAAMSVVLYSAHLNFPKEIQGLREWAIGLVLLVLGAVLFGLRDISPVMPVCANSFLIWGVGCTMIGTERFYGVRPSWWLFNLVWGAAATGISFWLLVVPNFSARVATFSILAFVFYVRQVFLVWKYGDSHFTSQFFGTLMVIQSAVVLTRGLLAVMYGSADINLMIAGPFPSIYLAVGHFMILLMTVGFMTVCTRRLQTTLERRSTLDPLTEILNRRGFADIYAKEHALMRRESTCMTVLSIDIDYFKKINDGHGHAVGDRVLIDVAQVISKALRASDHVARFGGEEFLVLLPATGLDRALHVAERIQAALRAPRADVPMYTVSVGVACQTSADESLEGVLIRADKALYCAKERGRDRYEIAPDAGLALPARTGLMA